jgi:hypothetical protein
MSQLGLYYFVTKSIWSHKLRYLRNIIDWIFPQQYQLKSHLKLERNGRCSRGMQCWGRGLVMRRAGYYELCVVRFVAPRVAEASPKWVPYIGGCIGWPNQIELGYSWWCIGWPSQIELGYSWWCIGWPSQIELGYSWWCIGWPSQIELGYSWWCIGWPSQI